MHGYEVLAILPVLSLVFQLSTNSVQSLNGGRRCIRNMESSIC